ERLYPNIVVSDENSALKNEEYEDERTEEKEEEKEDTYKVDEFFIWDQEPGEYEEEEYEEQRSFEDEEAEEEEEEEGDAPSEDIATISTAEKPEEEVQQDVVGPDHVLAEIPVEVRINLSFCVILPVELLCLTTFVSRREILTRNRYEYILLQHRFEEIQIQLRNLETLGKEMTTMDYETLHMAQVNCKDKLDERDRELEKWRNKALLTACYWQIEIRIADIVNGVAHYKEKETCLAEDIKFEERELNEYCKQTAKVREDVNRLHLILRDLRWTYDEKRLEGGLLMAPPVLRETERKMKLLDAVRNDIEIIKREIHRYGPANGRKKTSSKGKGIDDDAGETRSFLINEIL
ncbi:hypothetical protein G5I_13461, partial [Acromyrmex echinatior]